MADKYLEIDGWKRGDQQPMDEATYQMKYLQEHSSDEQQNWSDHC